MKLSMKQRIMLRRLRKARAKRDKIKENPLAGVTVADLTLNDRSAA